MPEVIGSIALCSSPRSLVCDEQGVGKYPLWKKFPQLQQIVNSHIPEQYQSFFAQPVEVKEDDGAHIVWYAKADATIQPIRLTQLSAEEHEKYQRIKNDTIREYVAAIDQCKQSGEQSDAEHLEKAMKHVGSFDDYFYCFDDRVVVVLWGMRPRNTSDAASCVIDKTLKLNKSYAVTFDLGNHGTSSSKLELHKRASDQPIGAHQIPQVLANDGYIFIGWDQDPLNFKVTQDVTFVAQYEKKPEPPVAEPQSVEPPVVPPVPPEPKNYSIRFEDENGVELSSCSVSDGQTIPQSAIPAVPAKDHYKFTGWGGDLSTPVHEDRTYRLHYEQMPLSWWERFKIWWRETGCLKWLLRLLLLLLLLLLCYFLLRQCGHDVHDGCTAWLPETPGSNYTGENPFLPNDPGRGRNNPVTPGDPGISNPPMSPEDPGMSYPPISPEDPGFEFLPEHPNKPVPIPGDDDLIDDEDGNRKIVADRLNVLLDDDNLTINQFAADFKAVYADDKYQIIYADPIIKRLQLQVPAEERVQIKQELVSKLPEQYTEENTFIWDEALMEGSLIPNDKRISECWYHDAIKTYGAWDVTLGREDIIVAVVDNGFAVNHEEFKNKVVKPYCVFDRSSDVHESGVKHGTHVAGLAVAIANNQRGIAGVAPECKLMPVKVFDDGGRTSTTAVLDGVLYAVYNGADVVNLSLGMALNTSMPENLQQELIRSHFKEEERVWKKVFAIANRNNTAIVIAAGNENLMAGIEPMHRSEDVIVVAAVDESHNPIYNKSGFSNYGPFTDVSAPGANILSSVGRNKYEVMSGTSMAAPIVTGAVALIKSVNRPLSTSQIKQILQETGIEVNGNIGKLIQLDKALQKAKDADANLIDTHPEPTTGSVQILLEWHDYNDLDLFCQDPNGETIWFNKKTSSSGGQLEIDMNAGSPYSSNPIENIYWPQSGAPTGIYKVGVLYYKRHDTNNAESDFKVTVRYGSNERLYQGTVYTPNDFIDICSFNFE